MYFPTMNEGSYWKTRRPGVKGRSKVKGPDKAGQPCRKAASKLAARIKDWENTIASSKNANPGNFHKPGSRQV